MRELLFFSPLNIEFTAFIVVVVMSVGSVFQSLLVINFLGLREPGSCWFSPSVVVLKEHVVQVLVNTTDRLNLVEMGRNVANLI